MRGLLLLRQSSYWMLFLVIVHCVTLYIGLIVVQNIVDILTIQLLYQLFISLEVVNIDTSAFSPAVEMSTVFLCLYT